MLISATSAIFAAAWAYGMYQNLRYLLPVLPLFAVLLATGYHYATLQWKRTLLSYSLIATLFVTVVANILNPSYWWSRLVSGSALPYNVVLGRQTPDNFLQQFVPGFGALQYLNATYRGRAQIWAPFFGNRLYSEAPIFFNDNYTVLPVRTKLAAIEREQDASTAHQALRELGFTHILVNATVRPMWLPEWERPAYLRSDFLDRFAVLEYADNGMPLYRLLPAESELPPRAEVGFLRDGGFEQVTIGDLGEWEALGQPHWDMSGEMARTGRVAAAVDANNRLRAGPFHAVAGHTYRLRVYARTEDPNATGTFEVQFLTSARQPLPGTWLPYIPDRDYRPFDFLATAPARAQYVQIALGGGAPQGWVWIDDVSLVELDLERPRHQQ